MFKKDGGYDLRTSAGRSGKEQSDEFVAVLVIFGAKIIFSCALFIGLRILWEQLLTVKAVAGATNPVALTKDFFLTLTKNVVSDPGFLAYSIAITLTVWLILYTPYAFFRHIRALKNDELGFILSLINVGLRWALPAWFIFIYLK
tara:strand:- start:4 stop:438 length:435 start_codon:yes stop_codon:yes gene_type:complete